MNLLNTISRLCHVLFLVVCTHCPRMTNINYILQAESIFLLKMNNYSFFTMLITEAPLPVTLQNLPSSPSKQKTRHLASYHKEDSILILIKVILFFPRELCTKTLRSFFAIFSSTLSMFGSVFRTFI